MNIALPSAVPEDVPPPDVRLAQIQSVEEEALYQCHHEAYSTGNAQYYFQMDETERRDDFKRIYAPNIQLHWCSHRVGRFLVTVCSSRKASSVSSCPWPYTPAEMLYRQCGFKDSGGNMTFKWKA